MNRRYQMGANESEVLFLDTLQGFETKLLSLYKRKTIESSKRDSLRFKYLANSKAKFLNTKSELLVLSLEYPQAVQELLISFLNDLQHRIPMTKLNSDIDNDFSAPPMNQGGDRNVSMLSPTNDLINFPLIAGYYDEAPYYKVLQHRVETKKKNEIDQEIENMFSSFNNRRAEDGTVLTVSMPPSKALLTYFARGDQEKIDAYPQVIQLLTTPTPYGNLVEIYNEMKRQVKEIANSAFEIMRTQIEIDRVENDFTVFVNEYISFTGSDLSPEELLKAMREKALEPEPEVVEVEEDVIMTTAAVEPVKKKSKLPLIASAVAGIFLLMK